MKFKKKYYMKSKDELIDEILDILEENKKLKKDNKRLEKEKNKIEKEFKKYKNSNTPSSSNKHIQPNTSGQQARTGAQRGAPKGHNGTNRKQNPEYQEIVDATKCPCCGSNDLEDDKILKRTVEEIPEPVQPKVTEYEIHIKHCKKCDKTFVPKKNKAPLKGKFGINLMIMVVFMKFLLRGVLRKTATFLETGFAMKMAPASVDAIIKRVADAATQEYDEIKARIKKAYVVYVDETSFSVLGKKQWVWVFRTKEDILLVIRPSRGNNVLEEILGKDYAGKVVCDCWRAYNFLENATLQRCWAHLLRKSKELCDSVAGDHFHKKLKELFEEIKVFNALNPTVEERQEKYLEMTKRLRKIVHYYAQYEELNSVANYVILNLENWFTCIKFEGIEPTNNFAEQAIRETVMVRKIIGAFRSETGKENYQKLASLISTWQLQKLDLQKELKKMLVKNLCFC